MSDPWARLRELLYDGDPNGLHWSGNETNDDIVEVVKFWLNEVTTGHAPYEELKYGTLDSGILMTGMAWIGDRPYFGKPHRRTVFGHTPWEPVE